MIDWTALARYAREEAKRRADDVGLSDDEFCAVVDAPRPYPTIIDQLKAGEQAIHRRAANKKAV